MDERSKPRRRRKTGESEIELPHDSFGLPQFRQGEGRHVLRYEGEDITITLPINQFYMMWELVEAKRVQHEKYLDGPLAHVGKAYAALVSKLRTGFYTSTYGHAFFSREINYRKLREEEAAKKAASSRRGAQKPAERSTEAAPVKKTRCRECYDGDREARCLGPAGHSGRHKDKSGRRWSTDE